MDQKVTTQAVLGELDARGVKFATLRMRSASLMKHIDSLAPADYKTDHPGPARPAQPAQGPRGPRRQADQLPRHRPPAHRHRPGPRAPTVIITNDDQHQDQGARQPVRPADDHRAAARRDHPRVLRRRPVLHRQPQRRPRRRARRPGPGPPRRAPRPARPATPPPPPTPSSAASWKPPARPSPPPTRSPSGSTPRLLTRPPQGGPATHHTRPLVGRTPHPLRDHLTLRRTSCTEMRD